MPREALTDEKLSPDFVEIVVIQVRKKPDKAKGERKRERLLRVMLNETVNLTAAERTELRNRLHQVAIDYCADLEAGAFEHRPPVVHAPLDPRDVARLAGAHPAAVGPAPKGKRGRKSASVERLANGVPVADVELLNRLGVRAPAVMGAPVPMTAPIERGAEGLSGRVATEDRAYELGPGEALDDAR